MGQYRNGEGRIVDVSDQEAAAYGYTPVSGTEQSAALEAQGVAARGDERGIVGSINAGATGVLSGLTLGASDVLVSSLANKGERERLNAEVEAHPYIRTGGEITGALVGAFADPASLIGKAPGAAASNFAAGVVERSLERGGIRGNAQALAAMGAEGAIQNAGQYIGHAAIADRDVTAEGLAAAAGTGFEFGVVGGGAALGVTRGTVAVRKMFSRVMEGGEEAAADAANAFKRTTQDVMDAHDAAAKAAREELDAIRGTRMEAEKAYQRAGIAVREEKVAAQRAAAEDVARAGAKKQADAVAKDARMADQRFAAEKTGVHPRETPLGEYVEPTVAPEVAATPEPVVSQADVGAPTAVGKRHAAIEESAPVTAEPAAPAKSAIPDYETVTKKLDETGGNYLEPTTIPARDIEAHGYYEPQAGGHSDPVRNAKAREIIKTGQRDPVRLLVTKDGRIVVEHGRHRLAAAIELDAPIKVEWSTGSAGAGKAADDVFRGGAKAAEAGGELEGQLAKMKGALDEGGSLKGMTGEPTVVTPKTGEPAYMTKMRDVVDRDLGIVRGATAEERAAKITAADQKAASTAAPHFDPAMAKREAELLEALNDFESSRAHILDKVVNEMAEKRAASLPLRGERGDDLAVPLEFGPKGRTAASDTAKVEGTVAGGPKGKKAALAKIEDAHEAALERAANAPSAPERAAAELEAETLEKQLTHEALPDDFVGDVAKHADEITKYEKAAAKLTETVGDAAPPAAHEAAAAFNAAGDDAVRRATDRTARAVEDFDKLSPAERVAHAKIAKSEAGVGVDKARLAETEAKGRYDAANATAKDTRKAFKAENPKAPAPKKGGGLVEAAGVSELLDIPGLPKASDLPVVGPLLGAWLKYRAVKAALGRVSGRIPASGNAKAAILAAQTKDKIARSVDRMLGLVEKVSAKAIAPSVTVAAALGRRIYDDGEHNPPPKSSVQELAGARMRELAAYVNTPGAIEDDVRREMRDVTDPDLIAATEKHRRMVLEHLLDTAPKLPMADPLSKRVVLPNEADAMKWGRRLQVANDPMTAFHALEGGHLTIEMSDTLKVAFPRLFALAQQRVLTMSSKVEEPVPYRTRAMMTLMFDMPLDQSLNPANVRIVQSVYAPKAGGAAVQAPGSAPTPAVPSMAGDVNLNTLYQTPLDGGAAR